MNQNEIDEILKNGEHGFLCLSKDNEPYAVPISYAYIDGKIVLHCSNIGRKLDILRANPRVCFAVAQYPNPIMPHNGKCDFNFASVQCFGVIRELTDRAERQEWLERFRSHFYRRLGLPSKPVTEAETNATSCLVITIARMSGRTKIV